MLAWLIVSGSCCCCVEMLVHVEPNRRELGPDFAQQRRRATAVRRPAVRLASWAIRHCPIRFSLVPNRQQSENLMSAVGGAGSERGGVAPARRAEDHVAPPGCKDCVPPPKIDRALVKAWRGRRQRMLESGEYVTLAELSAAERISRSYICRVLRLTCSPRISSSASWTGSRRLGLRSYCSRFRSSGRSSASSSQPGSRQAPMVSSAYFLLLLDSNSLNAAVGGARWSSNLCDAVERETSEHSAAAHCRTCQRRSTRGSGLPVAC